MEKKKVKQVALYVRVSTDDQTVENQLQALQISAQNHGWEIVEIFKDEGISGAKGRDKRPALDKLLKGVSRKDFDLVAAWSVDRLGRSLSHLVSFLSELRAKEVGLYLHQEGIDTSTPAGEAMFGMLGIFAQFERSIIRERVNAGLTRAKNQGKILGRPKRVNEEITQAVLQAKSEGKGIRAIAKEVGIGLGTVQRILKAS